MNFFTVSGVTDTRRSPAALSLSAPIFAIGRQFAMSRMTTNAATKQAAAPYFNSLTKLP
jgi:hypothetical protein